MTSSSYAISFLKSRKTYFFGIKGVDEPPGMTQSKLSHPPMTSPACLWMRSLSGTDISSSTVQGLLTCPEMLNNFVPEFLGLPKLANHSPPRRQISGATATVSTLVLKIEKNQIISYLHSFSFSKSNT